MNSNDQIYSFVFKGLLTEQALDQTQRIVPTKATDEAFKDIHQILGIDDLDEELVIQAQKMAIVYTALCAFENSVRQFVSNKLLEVKGEDWWEKSVSEKIRKQADVRKADEERIRWHSRRGANMINYTVFGDLMSIIRHADNWANFEPHLTSIEWASHIIDILERSRNVIMHGGELGKHDVQRIGMCIRDWVNQVG
jgi:hypothetical protein